MRLVVTGTRHATEAHRRDIEAALIVAVGHVMGGHVLAHGDASGVDRLAGAIAEQWGWKVKPIPAHWSECDTSLPAKLGGCPNDNGKHRRFRGATPYCPRAGNRRNQQLADLDPRPDIAIGFPAIGSAGRSGTWDALARFVDAGIVIGGVYPLAVGR